MLLMKCVFEIAAEALPDYRTQLVAHFLAHNQNVDDFRSLPIFDYVWLFPTFEAPIEFMNSILRLLSDFRFLAHRTVVEDYVVYLRRQIESERRRRYVDSD